METRLGPAGRDVDLVCQHSWRHDVGFIRDLMKVGSVGFVEDAVEHVGLFFVAKKAGAQRFIVDARASNRHFVRPPDGREKFFGMSNFRERLRRLRTGLYFRPISRTRFIKCAFLDGYKRFFALPAVIAPEVGCTGKNGQPKTSCSRLFDISRHHNTSNGFLLGVVFLSRCHGPLHALTALP